MVSQADYEGVYTDTQPRETAAEREISNLRRRLDQLEAEKLGLTVEQLHDQRFKDLAERYAATPTESPAVAELRRMEEQEAARQRLYLDHYGVPADADESLKTVICQLNTDPASQRLFRALVAAIAGEDPGDSDNLRDIVAWWPAISHEAGKALAAVVRHYATVYRSLPRAAVT